MPFRSFSRRKNFRKKVARRKAGFKRFRKYRRGPKTLVLRGQGRTLVPDRLRCKFFYQDTTKPERPASTLSVAIHNFWYHLNDIYDPDPTLSSGAVPGVVEWGSFYSSYRVLGCAWKIDVVNNSTAATYNPPIPIIVSVAPVISELSSSVVDVGDFPYSQTKTLSPTGGMDRCTFKGYISCSKLYGNKLEYMADASFSSNMGSSPAHPLYLAISCRTGNSTPVKANIAMYNVRLTYYTELYDRVQVLA